MPGCHPFVTKESYVFYRKARIESEAKIEAAITSGDFLARQPMPDPPLNSIIEGILSSNQTPRKIKKYLSA
jgi:hypothetical protein